MNRLLLILVAIHVAALADAADQPEAVTILSLGDSITAGSSGFSTYREFLVPALREQGFNVRFIGPNEDAHSRHAGYGGRNSRAIRSVVESAYKEYRADIVLLHSGHNSFSENKPIPGIVADTQAMIEHIHEVNPEATVLLAQVIPAGKLPKYEYIPELNDALGKLAEQLRKDGLNVVLVDQEAGFDWKTDTIGDKVHPNAGGARKMSAKWMEALEPILKAKAVRS